MLAQRRYIPKLSNADGRADTRSSQATFTSPSAAAEPSKKRKAAGTDKTNCELLLCNLPAGTTAKSLRAFFAETSPKEVCLLEDSNAIVYFSNPADVRRSQDRWDASSAAVNGVDRTASTKSKHWDASNSSQDHVAKRKRQNSKENRVAGLVISGDECATRPKQYDQFARAGAAADHAADHGSILNPSSTRRNDSSEDNLSQVAREIAAFARDRQLAGAVAAFRKLEESGVKPNVHIFASMMNAYVNSGNVDGAVGMFSKLRQAGLAPNVIVYTTLLKGYCRTGALQEAEGLLEDMVSSNPPVKPDTHSINTFLRGCTRVGDVEAAMRIFTRMQTTWMLKPDISGRAFVVRLLCQALRLQEAEDIASANESAKKAGCDQPDQPEQKRVLCQFWAAGKCKRGAKCLFIHDASIVQNRDKRALVQDSLATASMACDIAHGHALLGDWCACETAVNRAYTACDVADSSAEKANSDVAPQAHQEQARLRLRSDLERIRKSLTRKQISRLQACLGQVFIFSDQVPLTKRASAASLVKSLQSSFGLDEAVRLGFARSKSWFARRFRLSLSTFGRIRWHRVFGGSRKHLPIKMEICSGSGDWVIAQAVAEADTANWTALEIMHDRIHGIFSRMVLGGVENLRVLGGDAGKIVPERIPAESVSLICINYPEPPHISGDENAESSLHLLTAAFLQDVHKILVPAGRFTILSDNQRYLRSLASTFSCLRGHSGKLLFESVKKASDHFEDVDGMRIFWGLPGKKHGHCVQVASEFDTLWAASRRTDRTFLALKKVRDCGS